MRADIGFVKYGDFPSDPGLLAEGMARQVVGGLESRRLERAVNVSLGGGAIRVWQNADALSFADLGAWAGLRGWTAKRDDDRCVLTLTKDERTVVAPLGSPKIQVDGSWKDLPDVIVLKEGRWWAPLDALESAVKP